MPIISRRTLLQSLAAPAVLPRAGFTQPPGPAAAIVHRQPRPLAPEAVTHDWPSFLGPTHNGVSTETRLSRDLPPPLVWELPTGTGYASPAIAGDRLVYLHRIADEEVVECLHPETGAVHWRFRYATAYRDRYGYNNGPRASPVIDAAAGLVCTIGAEGLIHAIELGSGRLAWRKDVRADYRVSQDFFGTASTPLVDDGRLIVNVGAPGGPTVAAFDLRDRRARYGVPGTAWGAELRLAYPGGCARRALVSSSSPAANPNLLRRWVALDSNRQAGAVDFAFPWRSRTYESVNAACPVVFDNQVFITASYRAGGALDRPFSPDFTHEVAWTTQEFALHYNTPILPRRLSVRLRRQEHGRCLARLRRGGDRRRLSGARRRSGGRRSIQGGPRARDAHGYCARFAPGGGRTVPVPGRTRAT